TSRTCVMAVGIIKDKDGSEHEVSFSSVNQNEQLVAVAEPGKLGLNLARASLAVAPGQTLTLPFRVARGRGLAGQVRVDLVYPTHVKGIRSDTVSLKSDQDQGVLIIHCAKEHLGRFNMPLIVRATMGENPNLVV